MKLYFFLAFSCIISGCDFTSTKEKSLVGELILINPQTQSDNGYSLIMIKGNGLNENILNDYVMIIEGNDSILISKCKNVNGDDVYYEIKHNKGHLPIKVKKIDSDMFRDIESRVETKYSFSDEK